MTREHEVTNTHLTSVSGRLRTITDQLSEAVRSFQSEVSGFGEPWGGDDIGMIIGMAHGAIFGAAMESFNGSAGELAGRAGELVAAADTHRSAEDTSTAGVNRIKELLNGSATPA
ncbi:hypothetical protein GCM10010191_67510 [Actinomadura vinacea]|uniref:WXG100 family type VII secretion target n=1 Tax=Actinomadura vinacea TaxID=115336 RepID=A0ABN3JYW3_9ACTN